MRTNFQRSGRLGFLVSSLSFLLLAGCTGGTLAPNPEVSKMTEVSSDTRAVAAAGGTVTHDAITVTFPAGILPADTSIKISKVTVSNSEQDESLIDLTDAYVISATSAARTLELTDSANISFKVNSAGIDESSIRLVVWDGYEWEEIPADYDANLKAVSATIEAILPFGTRIYLANPEASSTGRRESGEQIVSEFVAMKVVGESLGSSDQMVASVIMADAVVQATEIKLGRKVFFNSPKGKFKVSYIQPKTVEEANALKSKAEDVAGYMDNAYESIVTGMGFNAPDKTTKAGYGKTWPVDLTEMSGVYGTADPGTNSISVNSGASAGDGLAHTCHHEFTHLVQFKVLWDATPPNDIEDSLDWFGETMADAVGYYAQKGLGTIYCLAGESMGYFDVRLDADKHTLGSNNEDYEYRHFPFISYLLATYGNAKFKNFFVNWYQQTPGKTKISMDTIDASALFGLGKVISGRDGIFWDFYWDYFISGTVLNKNKFLNLPDRDSGRPFDITDDNKEKQGATIVEIGSDTSYEKVFTIQRLSGQVLILRYKGSSSIGLTLKVVSAPGEANGRIRLVPLKRQGGVLQSVSTYDDVSDNSTKTKEYTGVGGDIHDIYVLMVNTNYKKDDYKVTVTATGNK